MFLTCNRPFKSVHFAGRIELPRFTVLTGINGAGKSHLLEAIEKNAISIEGIPPNVANGTQTIRRFDYTNLVPQDTGPFSTAQIASEQSSYWNEIRQFQLQHEEQYTNDGRNQHPLLALWTADQLRGANTVRLQEAGLDLATAEVIAAQLEHVAQNHDNNVRSRFISNDAPNRNRFVTAMPPEATSRFFRITEDEFIDNFPKLWQPVDLFQQSFARLFTAYQRLVNLNRLLRQARIEGHDVENLTDDQFIQKHGRPPWLLVNEILEAAELRFRVNAPYQWDDRQYEPILTDVDRGTQVKFNDLSSGEKILMSFALCLIHATEQSSYAEFPKVLLFDEIDAPLHPSMTRSLLRTIQEVLVDKHSILVILTTHSPSTVALAPEECIHAMSKSGTPRVERVSNDRALGILTSDVPTLSVRYENRRQVFVESKYDVEYYSGIYERCKSMLSPDISLVFIPSAEAGNSDQVRSIVQQLEAAGTRTVRGVIDWDERNTRTGAVHVLGEGERYSIENFLLDPLLVGLLLLREKIVPFEQMGLPPGANYRELDVSVNWRAISDYVTNCITQEAERADSIQIRNCMGLALNVPRVVSLLQGHALERRIKEAFPGLRRFHRENELKLAVITHVLDDLPHLSPRAFMELFAALQLE